MSRAIILALFAIILVSAIANAQLQQQQYRRQASFRQTAPAPAPAQQQQQPITYYSEDELNKRPKVYEVRHQITPNTGDGHYKFFSEFSDGLTQEQEGFAHKPSSSVKEGTYTTFDENGQVVEINYIADKYGFQPANLPTSPPLPEEHVRAREAILAQQRAIKQEHARLG